jgi:small subunit ribosomal protein S21
LATITANGAIAATKLDGVLSLRISFLLRDANNVKFMPAVELTATERKTSMTQIRVGENEAIESALRRFKRQVSKSGIFQDIKSKRHFETPLEKKKRKTLAKHRQRKQRFNYQSS